MFVDDGRILLVMELKKGGELFDYVVEQGKLSEAAAAAMLRQVISAVDFMHAHGIIHRDLKARVRRPLSASPLRDARTRPQRARPHLSPAL